MKIFKILFLMVFIAGVIASCEDPEFASVADQRYVSFDVASGSIGEGSSTALLDGSASLTGASYAVTVNRSTTDLSSSLTVNISASGEYLFDSDFADAGDDAADEFSLSTDVNSLVIPAGEASATFLVTTVNDLLPKGNKQVTLTITGVSDNSFSVGNAQLAKSGTLSLSLIDDDCPIDIPGTWEGTYVVNKLEAAPGSFNDGFAVSSAVGLEVEIELDPSDPSGSSAIMLGGGAPNLFQTDVPLKFVTCSEEMLIGEGTHFMNFTQNGSSAGVSRSDEPDVYGNGTYIADGSSLTLTVSYTNVGGLNFDEFNLVLDRKEEE